MFIASNRRIPEGDLVGEIQSHKVGEMKLLQDLCEEGLTLSVGLRLEQRLSIQRHEVVHDIAPGSQLDNPQESIREDTLIHHEVHKVNPLLGVCEDGDGITRFVVRQKEPSGSPHELRYSQLVAVLDAPRFHEGLQWEQALHTSVR